MQSNNSCNCNSRSNNCNCKQHTAAATPLNPLPGFSHKAQIATRENRRSDEEAWRQMEGGDSTHRRIECTDAFKDGEPSGAELNSYNRVSEKIHDPKRFIQLIFSLRSQCALSFQRAFSVLARIPLDPGRVLPRSTDGSRHAVGTKAQRIYSFKASDTTLVPRLECQRISTIEGRFQTPHTATSRQIWMDIHMSKSIVLAWLHPRKSNVGKTNLDSQPLSP